MSGLSHDKEHVQRSGETRRWVLSKDAKLRLDQHLHSRLKGFSRNQIQRLIRLGHVLVNGRGPKPSTALHEGDVVEVTLPRSAMDRPGRIEPEAIPLDILYEDADMVVVNKPAGMIVHPARSHQTGTLLNAMAWHFKHDAPQSRGSSEEGGASADAPQPAGAADAPPPSAPPSADDALSNVGRDQARPGVVHRLDIDTTGVIVVAKRDRTHWLLSRQFEQRTNLKVYLALVHGGPNPPAGAIEQPLGRHPTIREAMAVRYDGNSKDALTLYRVRERYAGYSLVELELKTGRTHQIRVHLAYEGCPIVGDLLYGGAIVGPAELDDPPRPAGARLHLNYARDKAEAIKLREAAARRAAAGQRVMASPALHAAMLGIDLPVSGERRTFTAPVHGPLRELILDLRRRARPRPVVTSGCHIDLDQAV